MDRIKQQYTEETGRTVYEWFDGKELYFDSDYTEWLEKKVEQLNKEK